MTNDNANANANDNVSVHFRAMIYHNIKMAEFQNGDTEFNNGDSVVRAGMNGNIHASMLSLGSNSYDEALNFFFEYYNSDERWNFTERSLSVGDIIKVMRYEDFIEVDSRYYSISNSGFAKIKKDNFKILNKADPYYCCENAEKADCVCSPSYTCADHTNNGRVCLGSHD